MPSAAAAPRADSQPSDETAEHDDRRAPPAPRRPDRMRGGARPDAQAVGEHARHDLHQRGETRPGRGQRRGPEHRVLAERTGAVSEHHAQHRRPDDLDSRPQRAQQLRARPRLARAAPSPQPGARVLVLGELVDVVAQAGIAAAHRADRQAQLAAGVGLRRCSTRNASAKRRVSAGPSSLASASRFSRAAERAQRASRGSERSPRPGCTNPQAFTTRSRPSATP